MAAFFSGSIILSLMLAMLVGFSYAQRHWGVHPEITRKGVHVGMGLVTLSFPWVFDSVLPVVVLAAIAVLSLFLIRSVKLIKKRAGSALSEVDRGGLGEIYFPIGVAIVFVWAQGDALLYAIPILILTFADTLAALVGRFDGKLFFTTHEGHKTIEGSMAFLIMAMICIGVPLATFSDQSLSNVMLISLLLGVLIMLFEAISWAGIDNVLIPVFSFLLLKKYISLDETNIALHLGVLALLLAALVLWRYFSSLRTEAVLIATLYGYFAWAIAGTEWLLIAFLALVSYPFLTPQRKALTQRHGMHVVFYVAGSGAFWLALSQSWHSDSLFFAYCLTFAAHLAAICLIRHKAVSPETSTLWIVFVSVLKALAVIFVPYFIFTGIHSSQLWLALFAFFLILTVAAVFARLLPNLKNYHEHIGRDRWHLQTGIVFLSACVGIVPFLIVTESI